jgi:hypothetical protein
MPSVAGVSLSNGLRSNSEARAPSPRGRYQAIARTGSRRPSLHGPSDSLSMSPDGEGHVATTDGEVANGPRATTTAEEMTTMQVSPTVKPSRCQSPWAGPNRLVISNRAEADAVSRHALAHPRRPLAANGADANSGIATSAAYPSTANNPCRPSPDQPSRGVAATPKVQSPVTTAANHAGPSSAPRKAKPNPTTPSPNTTKPIVIATRVDAPTAARSLMARSTAE